MKKKWLIALLAAVPIAVVAGIAYFLFTPQITLTLADVVDSEYDAKDVTTEVVETTESVCGAQLDCVEAYSTAEANYYRFRSHAAADEYESTLKDGFSVNYFVMDFAGKNASVKDQLHAMQELAGTWNDYEGDFPAR